MTHKKFSFSTKTKAKIDATKIRGGGGWHIRQQPKKCNSPQFSSTCNLYERIWQAETEGRQTAAHVTIWRIKKWEEPFLWQTLIPPEVFGMTVRRICLLNGDKGCCLQPTVQYAYQTVKQLRVESTVASLTGDLKWQLILEIYCGATYSGRL